MKEYGYTVTVIFSRIRLSTHRPTHAQSEIDKERERASVCERKRERNREKKKDKAYH